MGGMAEIFKAKSHGAHGFEKTLVVKRILPHLASSPEFVRMFIDEAKVMVRINHPKVVQVLDFGEVDGHYFIAMEYIQGIDGLALLRSCVQRGVRPTTCIAVHIAAEVLDGLDFAHRLKGDDDKALGIIHRDISPSNIFISEQGEVKLGDFGIARAAFETKKNESQHLKGKYGYLSPEVVSGGGVDHRSDIFSIGVVLAELLMVRRLFVAKSDLEVLLQVRDAKLDRLDQYGEHIPADLRQILEAALERDPSLRYQDAATFRDALHRYLYDHRRMVRHMDVRRFLKRLRGEVEDTPMPELAQVTPPAGAVAKDKPKPPPVPKKGPPPLKQKKPTDDAADPEKTPEAPDAAPGMTPLVPHGPPLKEQRGLDSRRPPSSEAETPVAKDLDAERPGTKLPSNTEYSSTVRERIELRPKKKAARRRKKPEEKQTRKFTEDETFQVLKEKKRTREETAAKVAEAVEERRSRVTVATPAARSPGAPLLSDEESFTRRPPPEPAPPEEASVSSSGSISVEQPMSPLAMATGSARVSFHGELPDLSGEPPPESDAPAVEPESKGEPEAAALPDEPADSGPPRSIGKKRKIPVAPPPKPRPVPTATPQDGDYPPLGVDGVVDALPEMGSLATGSGWDHSAGKGRRPTKSKVKEAGEQGAATAKAEEVAATRVISSMPAEPSFSESGSFDLSDMNAIFSSSAMKGNLAKSSLISVTFLLAVNEESGLLVLQQKGTIKEIYFHNGHPLYVTSNRPDELFGQYLVKNELISEGELSMALAMLPHFEGKLGNALVALNLFRPVEILRHLTQQAHEKLLEAFGWTTGAYLFYHQEKYELEAAPVGLDAYELIGTAINRMPGDVIDKALSRYKDREPVALNPPPVPPEVFRMGKQPREVLNMLDGFNSVQDLLDRYEDPLLQDHFKRILYLLLETDFTLG